MVVAVFLVVYNSGIIQRNMTAVTIDGEKYTVADVSYYYQDAYQSFVNSYGDYISYFGLDTSKPLSSQQYSEDQTWADYFKEQAVTNMQFIHAALAKAQEEGLTLSEDQRATYDATLESIKSAASQAGYGYETYLRLIYGSAMTAGVYEKNLEEQLLATVPVWLLANRGDEASARLTHDTILQWEGERNDP